MAKSKKSKKSKSKKATGAGSPADKPTPASRRKDEPKITLADIDAMSDSDGDNDSEEWDKEALALRKAIQDGAFDGLLKKAKDEKNNEEEEEEIQEVLLDDEQDEMEEDEENENEVENTQEEEQEGQLREEKDDDDDDEEKEREEEQREEEKESDAKEAAKKDEKLEKEGEHEPADADTGDSDDDDDDEERQKQAAKHKALLSVTAELSAKSSKLPFGERFDVTPESRLPFGKHNTEGNPLDVHDDLKRELAFYNLALEATHTARDLCRKSRIPFARPDDFFAEMVKTDDHMAKIKDRLIFETKKMDAVAQRKANKEQKLRAKEKQSHKLEEKARQKREHMAMTEKWAKSAAANRGGALNDNDDAAFLQKMNGGAGSGRKRGWTDRDGNLQFGPNKKRQAADKKYGFGGKRGRFKQNDPKSLNDMTAFNPRGNFGGLGTKGKKPRRAGKRARDAARSKK